MADKGANKETINAAQRASGGNLRRVVRPLRTRPVRLVLIAVILIAVGLIYYLGFYSSTPVMSPSAKASSETDMMDKALLKKDKTQALADAKRALSYEPHNIDAILAVASLSRAEDPSQAKQYYIRAFDEFKRQNNPDVNGRSAETYWAAAGLARQAGEISQAKQYYQKVVEAAKPSDSYEQSLAQQSQVALKELP